MPNNKKIEEYSNALYEADCPVVADKMILSYNADYGTNVLQISFRNLTQNVLYSLSIIVECRNKANQPTREREVEYNYYGMEVQAFRAFGALEEIVMEQDAVQFTLRVTRAEFGDGSVCRGDTVLQPIHEAHPIQELQDFEKPFCDAVAEVRPKLKPKFVPEKHKDYWRCTCGRVYPLSVSQCKVCGLDKLFITDLYQKLLAERAQQEEEEKEKMRAAVEAEERRRLLEEAREAEEERIKREKLEEERRAFEKEEARLAEEQRDREALRMRKRHRTILAVAILASVAIILVGGFFGIRGITAGLKKRAEVVESQAVSSAEESANSMEESRKAADAESLAAAEASRAESESAAEASRLESEAAAESSRLESEAEADASREASAAAAESSWAAAASIGGGSGSGYTGAVSTTVNGHLNLREGPGTEYAIIGKLSPSTVIYIIGQEGDWYKVFADQKTGYVHKDYLTIAQ